MIVVLVLNGEHAWSFNMIRVRQVPQSLDSLQILACNDNKEKDRNKKKIGEKMSVPTGKQFVTI